MATVPVGIQSWHLPNASPERWGYNRFVGVYVVNPLKTSGHYMYHQFNIQQFCVLPTQCIYLFYMDLRTNIDYFPIQH